MRRGIVDDRTMRRLAVEKLAELGCLVSPNALVRHISLADRQLVQIARALLDEYKLVIFDEPTASLTLTETDALLRVILDIKKKGAAVLYISPPFAGGEGDRRPVTVLRDGKLITTRPAEGLEPSTWRG
jgi:ribose transport system ATP-binding protein